MTTKQRFTTHADPAADPIDPLAQVDADIAEADAKIRRAREEAAAARKAAGMAHHYRADVVVMWFDPAAGWRRAFGAKLTIPYPTVPALHLLIDFLIASFHGVSKAHQVSAAAITQDPDTGRHVAAYAQVGPNTKLI